MLVQTGKYRTEDRLKIQTIHISQTKHNPEKANNAKLSKTKPPSVQSPFTTLSQETRWAYSTTPLSTHRATGRHGNPTTRPIHGWGL